MGVFLQQQQQHGTAYEWGVLRLLGEGLGKDWERIGEGIGKKMQVVFLKFW
jgi:hypothetical protein